MKKLLLMLAIVFAGIVSASAESSNAYAYVSDVSYSDTTIKVWISPTELTKSDYNSVTIQISPSNAISGLVVDQVKTVSISTSATWVGFTCKNGGDASDMCRSYQWNIRVVNSSKK